MRKDFYSYPAVFYYDEDGVSVEFPDLPGCLTCAGSTEEAFRSAREAMGLHLCGLEDDGDPIPDPTPFQKIRPEEGGVVTMIDVSMPLIRSRVKNVSVKKTLTIPAWLNMAAEEAHVNFSQVLQEGLKARLGFQ